MCPAWGRQITVRIARIVIRVSERIPVIEEEPNCLNRDRESQSFSKSNLHVRDANHFPCHVEQWSAAVAGVDLRRGLQIKFPPQLPRFGAQNSFGHGPLQSQRAPDRKHTLSDRQSVCIPKQNVRELRSLLVFNLQQSEVLELVDSYDAHLLVRLALELPVLLAIYLH